jgi:hypothetical protein
MPSGFRSGYRGQQPGERHEGLVSAIDPGKERRMRRRHSHGLRLVKGESPSEIDVTNQSFAAGQHAVHFKSWTKAGICPVISVDFTVVDSGEQAPYGVPGDAISSGDLDGKGPWTETHDGGTPGKSKGSMVYPAHTPTYDDGREFYMTYTDRAGERWSVDVAKDPDATYFVLDTYVYLPNPSEVLNLELYIDQVVADGETVILSTQCSGVNGSWEAGYTAGKEDHWWASGIKCNPAEWTANVWHHIQIGEHRDANGVVTHDWVSVDGKVSNWGYTQESAHYLDWGAGVVNIQYQIEGTSKTSGTVTSYIHNMTVYRWQP